MDNKEYFIEKLKATGRKGIDKVVERLDGLGFFQAPASTVFHLNTEGGLLQHSINVYRRPWQSARSRSRCARRQRNCFHWTASL